MRHAKPRRRGSRRGVVSGFRQRVEKTTNPDKSMTSTGNDAKNNGGKGVCQWR